MFTSISQDIKDLEEAKKLQDEGRPIEALKILLK